MSATRPIVSEEEFAGSTPRRAYATALEEWIGRSEDQDFTFTDAVSFVVMAERGIREALTQDRHLATAGFVVVPAGR